jgi:tRNA A-37 threonylcarbamoyl transferase component Bud32/ActR/RegA family two-component response regulator
MQTSSGPTLIAVGGDPQRLEWLKHHVTSQWADAQMTTPDTTPEDELRHHIDVANPDAVFVQIDFGAESSVNAALRQMGSWLAQHPDLHCIVLAENGDELTAVRAIRSGARDYLPLARLTRELLIESVEAAIERRRAATHASSSSQGGQAGPLIEVPGYNIVKRIATSNFSSVFLAKSERLRRNVILKTMTRGTSARELDDAERFQREYEIISSISHRAIAEIYDFGTLPQHLFLSMEYFPCGDLRARLRNPLSTTESLYYLRSIAEALRVIHVFGVLHRDLKPANVMLREDNSPVLIDFGLARRAVDENTVTAHGQIVGSPYYISPEQSMGQEVDARTDLYSLGVMFYEMLTGQRPYAGKSALEIMEQHVSAPVPQLPEALAQHQPIIERLLAKGPHHRYVSTDELLADVPPVEAPATAGLAEA